jgi:hypothetical protein
MPVSNSPVAVSFSPMNAISCPPSDAIFCEDRSQECSILLYDCDKGGHLVCIIAWICQIRVNDSPS